MQKFAAAATKAPSTTTLFKILGPIVVTVDGVPARLGGPRQVAVLARLLFSAGQVVSMEQLVEAVWDGDCPARPEVTIRSYISNLRRVIEPGRHRGRSDSCIQSRAPGYRIVVDPSALDSQCFEPLVSAARAALAADNVEGALDLVTEALELWRGDPGEGLVETDAILGPRWRLGELRLVAVELQAETRLAIGQHEAVVADLETALAANPLRERLTELMMLALYRSGRQSEALAICSELRTHLVERLGIDPGPAIQELEHKILTHDVSLLYIQPGSTTARAGQGFEFIFGRDDELQALSRIGVTLSEGRPASVVITGEPGSGKSVLAAGVAGGLEQRGVAVAWGRCRAVAQQQMLWPWTQLLDGLIMVGGEDKMEGLHGLRALSPSLGSALTSPPSPPTTTAEAASYFQPIVEYLRRLTRERPLALVFEDVHWADEASIELLVHAGNALADVPIGFVVTWRPTDLAGDVRRPLRQLVRLPELTRIELTGLDSTAVEQIVDVTHPGEPNLARRLHQVTAGNPMLLNELIAGLDSDRSPLGEETPIVPTTNIRDAILDRVERAHPEGLDALIVASLLGRPFSSEIVAGAAELPRALVDDVLDTAVAAGLLAVGDQDGHSYQFVHPIAAIVLAEELTTPRRARLHTAIGHALWRGGYPPAELAHHFAQAGSTGTSILAARFAVQSVDEESDPEVIQTAADIVERGRVDLARLDNTDGLEIEFCVFLSHWVRLQGDAERFELLSTQAVRAAEGQHDSKLLLLALLAATGSSPVGPSWARLDWLGVMADPERFADAMSRCLNQIPDHQLAPVLRSRNSTSRGLGPPAASAPELAVARERANFLLDRGSPSDRRLGAEALAQLAGGDGHEHDRVLAARLDAVAALDTADIARLDHVLSDLKLMLDHRRPSLLWLDVTTLTVSIDLYLGRLGPAREALDATRNRCQEWGLATATSLDLQLLIADWGQGTLAEGWSPSSDDDDHLDGYRTNEERVLTVITRGRSQSLAATALEALRARRRDQRPTAAQALEALLPWRQSMVTAARGLVILGPASYYGAQAALAINNIDLAQELLDHSEQHSRQVEARPSLIRTLIAQAEIGALERDRDRVEAVLAEANSLAGHVGLGWIETPSVS